jgi:hypothetical protein
MPLDDRPALDVNEIDAEITPEMISAGVSRLLTTYDVAYANEEDTVALIFSDMLAAHGGLLTPKP